MKNTIRILLTFIIAFAIHPAHAEKASPTKWRVDNGTIVVESPARPAGQMSAIALTTPKLPVIRIAFVGLGMRGPGAVKRWTHIPGVRVVALCDHEAKRAEDCQSILRKAGMPDADVYSGENGYKALCERNDINLVYVATDWQHHVPVAKYAMEHGKHVAIEVPTAMNLQDCWDLINLSETKRLHCIMLENCCYDFFELTTLNMAQHGLFGELLHVEGAYIHDLSPYWKEYWNNWRLAHNRIQRGDVYATHGLGPVAQLLNIHRGDRMKTLVAMDTRPVSGPKWWKEVTGETISEKDFRNADHTTTLIRTEQGKVMEIQHDVMNPQPYNRKYQLTGTKGFANKYPTSGYALEIKHMQANGVKPNHENLSSHSFLPDDVRKELEQKYRSPLVERYEAEAKRVGGHGGMDFIMDSRIAYCLRNGLPMDIDVYDMAEWCCLAELGSLSMDNGCMPVAVPDFTRGHSNDLHSFTHAWAQPADEAIADSIARSYTELLKTRGAKEADKRLPKLIKAISK